MNLLQTHPISRSYSAALKCPSTRFVSSLIAIFLLVCLVRKADTAQANLNSGSPAESSPASSDSPPAPANVIDVQADLSSAGTPLNHFWSTCVGAGRANEGLRASWLEQLKLVHDECGFQYVRFHGLFHSDMFVYSGTRKGAVYNWQYIDDLFDRMLAMGVRPFVELSFNPIDPPPGAGGSRGRENAKLVANKNGTNAKKNSKAPSSVDGKVAQGKNVWRGHFWWRANASPPSDNAKWSDLVEQFTRHCVARYGRGEVRKWYFEVWNEPNLDAFFHGGDQRKYFELYKVSALAIKKVDSQLRVGGPATSNFLVKLPPGAAHARVDHEPTPADVEALNWRPIWVEAFLSYCHSSSLPLDFISTHPYPQDFPLDDMQTGVTKHVRRGADATRNDLRLLRHIVDASPYPKAEINLTEWSSSPGSRDFAHDCLPAAAFVVKANIDSIGLVNALSYWTFTDVFEESGAGKTIFHGGFGLVNYQGIVKPTFHAYRFLNALGDETISKTNGAIVTRHSNTGRLTALAYLYPPEVKISLPLANSLGNAEKLLSSGKPETLVLNLKGLAQSAKISIETLDATHGNAVAAWEAMGSPEPPTREQAAALRKAALATKLEVVHASATGELSLKRIIEPWSLVLINEE